MGFKEGNPTCGCCGSPPVACWPCGLPAKDLTLSWVNPAIGNGSVRLAYTPPGAWASGCTHGLLYWFVCSGGTLQFGATYFLSGSCPGGQQQTCASTGSPPFGLNLAEYSCAPLYFRFDASPGGCPVLSSGGYRSFIITE